MRTGRQMADIFISYSRDDRAPVEELAKFLEHEGYTVWWDPRLLGGESFRSAIDEQLKSARAIIVLWTANSVKSEWVTSEAEYAAEQKRLIPVRVAELEVGQIPRPFNQRQTELLGNRDGILAAIKRLGVAPRYAAGAGHDRFWKEVEQSADAEDYELYLKEFPDGPHAAFARMKIARLRRAAAAEPATLSAPAAPERLPRLTIRSPVSLPFVVLGGALVLSCAIFTAVLGKYEHRLAVLADAHDEQIRRIRIVEADLARTRTADEGDWAKFGALDRISGWNAYLARWPAGIYAAEAQQLVAKRLADGRRGARLKDDAGPVASLEFDLDGATLTARSESGKVVIYDLITKEVVRRGRGEGVGRAPPLSPIKLYVSRYSDAQFLDGRFHFPQDSPLVFQRSSGERLVVDAGARWGNDLWVVALGGRFGLITAREDTYFLDTVNLRIAPFKPMVGRLTFAIDRAQSRILLAGEQELRFFRVADVSSATSFSVSESEVDVLALAPDGMTAASASRDGTVQLWDLSDL